MIYLSNFQKISDEDYVVNFIHYKPFDVEHGLGDTIEGLEREGALVSSIPTTETPEGMVAKLHFNPITKELWYVYEVIQKTQEELQRELIDQLILDNLKMQTQIDSLITTSL